MNWTFPGFKSYGVGVLMILVSGLYGQGYINEQTYKAVMGLLTGGGLLAIRAAIAKLEKTQ